MSVYMYQNCSVAAGWTTQCLDQCRQTVFNTHDTLKLNNASGSNMISKKPVVTLLRVRVGVYIFC
jgi:hypothetical protein